MQPKKNVHKTLTWRGHHPNVIGLIKTVYLLGYFLNTCCGSCSEVLYEKRVLKNFEKNS